MALLTAKIFACVVHQGNVQFVGLAILFPLCGRRI